MRKKINLPWHIWAKIFFSSNYEFSSQIIKTTPLIKFDISRIEKTTVCKYQLQFWVRARCIYGTKSLDFVLSDTVKKCKCISHLILILCLQHASLLKAKPWQRCFFQNFQKYFSLHFFWKRDSITIVFCKFWKSFQTNIIAEHVQRDAYNDMISARFFCKIYC